MSPFDAPHDSYLQLRTERLSYPYILDFTCILKYLLFAVDTYS